MAQGSRSGHAGGGAGRGRRRQPHRPTRPHLGRRRHRRVPVRLRHRGHQRRGRRARRRLRAVRRADRASRSPAPCSAARSGPGSPAAPPTGSAAPAGDDRRGRAVHRERARLRPRRSGVWDLILWRVVGGLGVGVASVIAPAYIAEVAPAHIRGRLGSLQQLAIVTGIFVALLSDAFLAGAAGGAAEELWLGPDRVALDVPRRDRPRGRLRRARPHHPRVARGSSSPAARRAAPATCCCGS